MIYIKLWKEISKHERSNGLQQFAGFKESGLVKELTYGDSSSRFDFVTSEHYHAICERCGKIVDFHYPGLDEVEQLASHVTGFKVSHHRLEIYGLCQECDKKKAIKKSWPLFNGQLILLQHLLRLSIIRFVKLFSFEVFVQCQRLPAMHAHINPA